MKTVHTSEQLRWHLQNNVMPALTDKAINGILNTLDKLNKGEISLYDQIAPNADCTVGEMCEDLRIDLEEIDLIEA